MIEKDYEIAIKTYQRPEELFKKTLSVLRKNNIPESKVTLFITDEEEQKKTAITNLLDDILSSEEEACESCAI